MKPALFTAFVLWSCAIAAGQFPYLHVYLNTPNCYAHSMGAMMLDSIDQRCAKKIIITEKGAAMAEQLSASLGLAAGTVVTRTLPNDQFNRELWQGGFSRFVFGMGKDTTYDTNLDFLFQYADSINMRIAQADPLPLLRVTPPLRTSGNSASAQLIGGDLYLLDEFLNRMSRCKVDTARHAISHTTLQLPVALDAATSTTLDTSNLFQRSIRYEGICPMDPDDGSPRLFAKLERGKDAKGYMMRDDVLLTVSPQGHIKAAGFKALDGYGADASEGAIVNDTLYMQTYRTGAEQHEVHWGAFVLKDTTYVQVKGPKKAEPFPKWIDDTLHGNYCNGSFVDNSFFFRSLPLMYHLPTGKFTDLGKMLDIPLDSAVQRLSEHRFGSFSCSDVWLDGDTLTILYWKDRAPHHATIDLLTNKVIRTGPIAVPNGYSMAFVMLDRDHLLYLADDQLHAWIIPLK